MKIPKKIILPLVIGVLIGTFVMSWVDTPHISICLINAGVTLVVGWWIHSAVRRRGESERVSTDYLSNLSRRIDELIMTCQGVTNRGPDGTIEFTRLSNEIYWLCIVAEKMKPSLTSSVEKLRTHFFIFKTHLTGDANPEIGLALMEANEMRMTVLKIHWDLCRCVLDRRTDTGLFPGFEDDV